MTELEIEQCEIVFDPYVGKWADWTSIEQAVAVSQDIVGRMAQEIRLLSGHLAAHEYREKHPLRKFAERHQRPADPERQGD